MACIYRITNMTNGKIYIGSTINFKQRKIQHTSKLNNNEHHSKKLQNAWNKYGEESFEFDIVEDNVPDENAFDVEQNYINILNPYYNGTKEVTGATRKINCTTCNKEFTTRGPAKYCPACRKEMNKEFFENRDTYISMYSSGVKRSRYDLKENYNDWSVDDWIACYWDDAMEK